jgi:hypothetical protein
MLRVRWPKRLFRESIKPGQAGLKQRRGWRLMDHWYDRFFATAQ